MKNFGFMGVLRLSFLIALSLVLCGQIWASEVAVFRRAVPVVQESEPTVEEMAAQMLMVGYRGIDLDDSSPIVKHIKAGYVGNVILFDSPQSKENRYAINIRSPEQVRDMIAILREANPSEVPLWVAVDQEGGAVQRLKPYRGFKEAYPSAQRLGKKGLDETRNVAKRMGQELSGLGVDVNFAPVADVNTNPKSPAVGAIGRSFSGDPDKVTDYVLAFGEGLEEGGVVPCLKHFPGHGSARADTHDGAADVSGTWSEIELIPYRKAIESGWSGMIMSSHVYNKSWDEKYPASLSRKVMTGMLREDLGWDGVIVTDDLHMGALSRKYTMEQCIYLAVEAGADMLIFSSNASHMKFDPEFPAKAHRALVKMVRDGRISEERMRASWDRITSLKRRHSLGK